ncbi:hypothetical protein BDF20DRAFT_872038 [Mycotypha africana]|uniref:uncharacterized protein n=1 Tax=Mycotypha africana TaxID=64632 RepID=UPI0023014AF7|nr:uncharacterized protein BDF20DRAFT_872038 [Mycotypha africana]KAI8979851.1 hypothetical protein BDF20DRAFT_872038 [Mycotypha africana]
MLLKHHLYVVTGANRGFGRTIAQTIVKRSKCKTTLVLVSRNHQQLETFIAGKENVSCHFIANANLQGAKEAEETVINQLHKLLKQWQNEDVAPITNAFLINNAGSTGDLSKKVKDYEALEIQEYINFNITSYAMLVSGFIRLFAKDIVQTTIVNISSLLAVQPFPNWGLYATGKTARDMLLKIVAKEEPSICTLSYSPGPLDNQMQKQVRETIGDTEQNTLYTNMANENKLVKMEDSACKLFDILEESKFESGSHIDFYDDV